MNFVKQGLFLPLLLAGVLLFITGVSSEPGLKSRKLRPVRPITSPVSYDNDSTKSGLYLEVPPYQWQKVTKIDQRRRWRLKMFANHPVQLYLLDPREEVGNPPNRVKINSWARRKWDRVEEIAEDKFLPFGNEAAYGGTWNLYLYNQSPKIAKVQLFIDTSGKPTAEEKHIQPFFLFLLLLLTGVVNFLLYKLLKWRRANPLKNDTWG